MNNASGGAVLPLHHGVSLLIAVRTGPVVAQRILERNRIRKPPRCSGAVSLVANAGSFQRRESELGRIPGPTRLSMTGQRAHLDDYICLSRVPRDEYREDLAFVVPTTESPLPSHRRSDRRDPKNEEQLVPVRRRVALAESVRARWNEVIIDARKVRQPEPRGREG